MKKESLIQIRTFSYSLTIIELYKLLSSQKEFILSKQILRSATSIGANVEEATAAISKRDFIAKMSIASKEARETRYWLRLLNHSQLVKYEYNELIKEAEEIIRILTAIVKTSQTNLQTHN
ncbi:MAG TPA: four helix bundle protein [Cytophagaceae bacterium]|nr:four helix bundle protein [Cytophagaceae bacterium]